MQISIYYSSYIHMHYTHTYTQTHRDMISQRHRILRLWARYIILRAENIRLRAVIAQRMMQIAGLRMRIAMVDTATGVMMMYLELFHSKRKRTLNDSEKEKLK
jgi:hypothetical protein